MTDQEINIAIAEACGWTAYEAYNGDTRIRQGDRWKDLPNYCNDLNAMHEAEEVLMPEQRDNYHNTFYEILPGDENMGPIEEDGPDLMIASRFALVHATARQRAEAFLRTLGKWIE